MTATSGKRVAEEIIDALGLSDFLVCDIKMHFPIDGAVSVTVTYYPDEYHTLNAIKIIHDINIGGRNDDNN